jgi:hypothetical protein
MRDVESLEIVIHVPERLIARGGIAGLERPEVHFDADTRADGWLAAEIGENAAEADPIAQTYEVTMKLRPPPGLTVFPGMTATVRMRLGGAAAQERADAALSRVPARAVLHAPGDGAFVWVIPAEGGLPRRKSVVPVAIVGDAMDVRNGPSPGDLVATAGLHVLREDERVRPMALDKNGLDG